MAAMAMLLPPISGRLVGSRGARIPLCIAGTGLSISCAMLAQVKGNTPFWYLFCCYLVFGAGFGFVNAPITNAAISGMPRAQAGVAGAIASASRQVGSTLGVAVVGALVASSLGVLVTNGSGARSRIGQLAVASHAGWWVLFGCAIAVFLLSFLVTSPWAKASAVRTAQELNPEFLEDHRRG
jgi:MFS family permease